MLEEIYWIFIFEKVYFVILHHTLCLHYSPKINYGSFILNFDATGRAANDGKIMPNLEKRFDREISS